jgi:hypothetical protein
MPEMSLRAYARHRGVTHQTVRKALARRRIVALRREGNAIIVDSDDADRRLAQWQEHARQQTEAQQQRRDETSKAYAAARAVKETYRARLAALEHDVRAGKLVHVDDVRVAAFNAARMARDSLLGIADRVAPQVPSRSLAEVHGLLRDEVARLCEVISGAERV